MFRMLKLRPLHGWNAVAWELAIVTLGVLIALGAQQVVETLHDRSTAAETRKDVTDELNSDLMSIALRHRPSRASIAALASFGKYSRNGRRQDRSSGRVGSPRRR